VDDQRPRHAALPGAAHRGLAGQGGFNSGYYSNPEVDALLEEARTATDQDRARSSTARCRSIVQEDAPWVFVANWKQNAVTSDRVENFALEPSFFLLLDDVVKN
jgi:peptide/nickel transport system substrate-binding protein